MSGFNRPPLQVSGLSGIADSAEAWKRFTAATLMATAALLLCAVIVVILAPVLPHLAAATHAAGLNLSPISLHARV